MQIHNRYRDWGGEDTVQKLERELLEKYGHSVDLLEVKNSELGAIGQIHAMKSYITGRNYEKLLNAFEIGTYDIIHVHNTFLQISPHIIRFLRESKIPVVVTLHNYRYLCINGLLFVDSARCTSCVESVSPKSIIRKCYKSHQIASLGLSCAVKMHRHIKLIEYANILICPSELTRKIYSDSGVPRDKLVVKSHFTFKQKVQMQRENLVIFVGRVSQEKGAFKLIEAWIKVKPLDYKLIMIGNHEIDNVKDFERHNIFFTGQLDREDVINLMLRAKFNVVATELFETFGMVVLESMSCGLPSAMPEYYAGAGIETIGEAFVTFKNNDELEDVITNITTIDSSKWLEMSESAKKSFEKFYTPERNYKELMDIYHQAIEESS
nr:glycosyltransferase family 4 protein [Deinococcus sp. RIT780]